MPQRFYSALIVDDEKHCREFLKRQILQFCPELEITGLYGNAKETMGAIGEKNPALIFLDVEMPGMNGFDLLAQIRDIRFKIIFTTGFERYAIRAMRFGALDYLVKPIDQHELRAAVDRFLANTRENTAVQLEALFSQLGRSGKPAFEKIAFPTLHGYELISQQNIIACESESNYTRVYLKTGSPLLVSKTLKDIAQILDESPFFRVHHSFLVNLNEATRYIKGEGGFLILTGDMQVPVSRNKKDELLRMVTHLS